MDLPAPRYESRQSMQPPLATSSLFHLIRDEGQDWAICARTAHCKCSMKVTQSRGELVRARWTTANCIYSQTKKRKLAVVGASLALDTVTVLQLTVRSVTGRWFSNWSLTQYWLISTATCSSVTEWATGTPLTYTATCSSVSEWVTDTTLT